MPSAEVVFLMALTVSAAGLLPAVGAFLRTFHRPRAVRLVRVRVGRRSLKRVSGYTGEVERV